MGAMQRQVYNIIPMGKPRMTQRDRWKRRDVVLRYRAFCDECLWRGIALPESGWHVTFVLPMPRSWPPKKRAEMNGRPHQQKPDLDNLEKALLDAVFEEDCRVWDGRTTKIWGERGQIIIEATASKEAA